MSLVRYLGKKKERSDTPLRGLEPAIFGLGGRFVIYYATEAGADSTQQLKFTALVIYGALEALQVSVGIQINSLFECFVKICKLLVLVKKAMFLPGLIVCALESGASGPGSSSGSVLGQDTLLSQCLSPPRCLNGYRRT